MKELSLSTLIKESNIISNNAMEVYKYLGIEAAKRTIVDQLQGILSTEMINKIHFELYAYTMCFSGIPLALNKSGLRVREVQDPLLKMSTSHPIQAMIEAAKNGINNKISSASSSMMIGAVPKYGTKYHEYSIDEEYVKKHLENTTNEILDALK